MSTAPLASKVNLKRLLELEQRVNQQAALLVTRAVNDLADATNTLAYLTEQVEIGNSGAREVLKKYFVMAQRAQAAAAGVIMPASVTSTPSTSNDGQPN